MWVTDMIWNYAIEWCLIIIPLSIIFGWSYVFEICTGSLCAIPRAVKNSVLWGGQNVSRGSLVLALFPGRKIHDLSCESHDVLLFRPFVLGNCLKLAMFGPSYTSILCLRSSLWTCWCQDPLFFMVLRVDFGVSWNSDSCYHCLIRSKIL